MPRGGKRPGAGRKPSPIKDLLASARVLTHPSMPMTNATSSPIEEFDAPDALSPDERAVWVQQAPFAFAHRTLTRSSALSFERYCKVVVLERHEAESSGRGGSNHRGLLKLIDDYEQHFLLTANGRAMPVLEKSDNIAPSNKLSRFRRVTPA